MKIGRAWLRVLVAGLLFGCLTLRTASTQDFADWNGKWFKLSIKHSGYNAGQSGGASPYNETEVRYLKIWNVDEANKVITFSVYTYENSHWSGNSATLNYLGGDAQDFLWYFSDYNGDSGSGSGFTARVQGKTKGGSLTSTTIKSLAGFEWDANKGRAGGITIAGSLIPESKLPPDLPKLQTFDFSLLEFPFLSPGNIERLAAFGIPNWSGTQPHNGIDLILYTSLSSTKIISPAKGMVQSITTSEKSYSNPVNQLLLTVGIFINYEWTIALVFEPGTANEGTKAAQMSAMKVQAGQLVEIGQEIGDLIVGELGYPHLHYMPIRNGQAVCAYSYSSDAAKRIFDDIAARSSGAICYQSQ